MVPVVKWSFCILISSIYRLPHLYHTGTPSEIINGTVLVCILDQTFHQNQFYKDFFLRYPIKHTLLILVLLNSNFELLLSFLFYLYRHLDLPTASQIHAFDWSIKWGQGRMGSKGHMGVNDSSYGIFIRPVPES